MKMVGLICAALSAALFLSTSAFAMIVVSTGVDDTDLILVVSYPWGPHASDIIRGSGLNETYPVRAPFGSLTMIETPNDLNSLRAGGAWLLLDGKKVANLCSPRV